MDNNINFKGVFVVNKPNVVLRQAIKSAGKLSPEQILPEYTGKNSILYIVKDCYDKNVASILVGTPNSKFRYYPTLDAKSGFSTKIKSEALAMLASAKDSVITSKEKLVNAFKQKSRNIIKINIRRIQERNLKLMSKETLIDLNDANYQKNIDIQTGVCKIFTKIYDSKTGKYKRHTLIEITPPDKLGICYSKYTPVAIEEKTRRIAINKNGEKIFEYNTPAPLYFKQNVKEAKQYYSSQFNK